MLRLKSANLGPCTNFLNYYNRDYEKQLEQAKIAYSLDPLSFATANSYFTALTANEKYDEAERLMKKVEETSDENNRFVIDRSYFRLYSDQRDFKKGDSIFERNC